MQCFMTQLWRVTALVEISPMRRVWLAYLAQAESPSEAYQITLAAIGKAYPACPIFQVNTGRVPNPCAILYDGQDD